VNHFAIMFASVAIALILLAGITLFVSSRVRRAPSVATRNATEVDVSFIVCARQWQSALLRWCGIAFVAVGLVCLLIAIVVPGQEGAGIGGIFIALLGLCFVWMARGVARARLEVTPDSIWVFRWRGAPRQIPLHEIARLTPLTSNNYGGIVAHSTQRRLFSATRITLGYPQLIEYLQKRRPDLAIPVASWPL